MKTKICKVPGCTNPVMHNRLICHEHRLAQVREYCRARPSDSRRIYRCRCVVCGNQFMGYKVDSLYCSDECVRFATSFLSGDADNNYKLSGKQGKLAFLHRDMARKMLGRELSGDEAIHHSDLNPTNNDPHNLLILSKSNHAKLHQFLKICATIMTLPDSPFRKKEAMDVIPAATELWGYLNHVNLVRVSDAAAMGERETRPV